MSAPRFGCVVLTQGNRPGDLRAALDSLLSQTGVETDVVVVGNAWEPTGLPEGVRGIHLEEDRGIPSGRNAGVAHTSGELLFFLDDDATIAEPWALSRVAALLTGGEGIGLVQLRVEARGGGQRSRDWVPRLRVDDPAKPGDVTAVWEGAVGMPRVVFEQTGGWPEEFRFVHEGVDLAWRVMDAGFRVRYAGDVSVTHPPRGLVSERHGYSIFYGARNRVFLARRNLPLPLGVLFVATFALRTLPHLRTPEHLRNAWRGYRAGMREPCGPRKRLRARTLWRMTRLGRPPIV